MGNDVPAVARPVVLSDVDLSIQDDGESRTDVADLHQRLARTIRAGFAKAAHALNIGRLQNWKHLVSASVYDRSGGGSHGKRSHIV